MTPEEELAAARKRIDVLLRNVAAHRREYRQALGRCREFEDLIRRQQETIDSHTHRLTAAYLELDDLRNRGEKE